MNHLVPFIPDGGHQEKEAGRHFHCTSNQGRQLEVDARRERSSDE